MQMNLAKANELTLRSESKMTQLLHLLVMQKQKSSLRASLISSGDVKIAVDVQSADPLRM